jgi:hypothetical protein
MLTKQTLFLNTNKQIQKTVKIQNKFKKCSTFLFAFIFIECGLIIDRKHVVCRISYMKKKLLSQILINYCIGKTDKKIK